MNVLVSSPSLRADLWPELPVTRDDHLEFNCRLEFPGGRTHRLWHRFPLEQQKLLTTRADPWLIAVLVCAMRHGKTLRVHGPVSAELLPNLDEFQRAFTVFHPGGYRVVGIEAERTEDLPTGRREARGLTAFSAGVDGAFSIYRHTARSTLQPKRRLHAALVMQGFDLAADDHATFERVVTRCRKFTDDAGLALHRGATNVRSLPVPWVHQFGAAVAASLTFFQSAYTFGIIPSAYSFSHLHLENGSNPLADPLLSSAAMTIVHDGAGNGRLDKLRHLAAWPVALDHLRVCWQGGRGTNCCRCEKCVRTMLMLELCGVRQCRAFPRPLTAGDLDRLSIPTLDGVNELSYLLSEARKAGRNDPWLTPLARAITRNRRYLRLQDAARLAGDSIPRQVRSGLTVLAKRLLGRSQPRPFESSGAPFAVPRSVESPS